MRTGGNGAHGELGAKGEPGIPMPILCVLRSGPGFGPEYVTRLRDGLARHIGPFGELACISDVEIPGVQAVPLGDNWPRWWPKMRLFDPDLAVNGKRIAGGELLLYLDLDTVIVGDFRHLPLAIADRDILITRDMNLREHREVPGLPAIGSAVMLWRHGAMRPVWDAFIADPEKAIHEHPKRMDHFIRKHLPPCEYIQDVFPGLVQCPKVGFTGRLMERPPEGAAVLCMWGRPRLHELPAGHWLRREWEGV